MIRVFGREVAVQQRLFWRSRESAFFTLLLPILFLVLLGSVYGDDEIDGIRASTYLAAGLIGYGIVATAFAGLAITLVVRRESGVLKRVRGTPLPTGVYLAAVLASTLVVIAIEVVAQVVVARFLLDADWPASPLALALVVLLGAATFAALGIAITAAVRSSEGSSAVVNAIYLPMAFVSGVFYSVEALPRFLEVLASVSPLTYLLRLVRGAFIAGAPIDGGDAAVLAAWGVLGFLVAARAFRWEPREV